MAWLMAKIYDRFMAQSEQACLQNWRADLVGGLAGRVLEVGAGTGANLRHYPEAVSELVITEPDRHMREILVREHPEIDVVDAPVERLPFEDASFDAVVATLVLCSVHGQTAALGEIQRVLRPGGSFVFLEHVASNRPGRQRVQHLLEPVWKRVAGNCHLTRETGAAIERAGLDVVDVQRESMRKALPFLRESIRGHAIKRA